MRKMLLTLIVALFIFVLSGCTVVRGYLITVDDQILVDNGIIPIDVLMISYDKKTDNFTEFNLPSVVFRFDEDLLNIKDETIISLDFYINNETICADSIEFFFDSNQETNRYFNFECYGTDTSMVDEDMELTFQLVYENVDSVEVVVSDTLIILSNLEEYFYNEFYDFYSDEMFLNRDDYLVMRINMNEEKNDVKNLIGISGQYYNSNILKELDVMFDTEVTLKLMINDEVLGYRQFMYSKSTYYNLDGTVEDVEFTFVFSKMYGSAERLTLAEYGFESSTVTITISYTDTNNEIQEYELTVIQDIDLYDYRWESR